MRFVFSTLLAWLTVSAGWAQSADSAAVYVFPRNYLSLAFVPQTLLVSGLRFDLEHALRPQHHLVWGLHVYSGEVSGDRSRPRVGTPAELTGGGLELAYRYYLTPPERGRNRMSTYVTGGVQALLFDFRFDADVLEPFVVDGITFFRFREAEQRQRLLRTSPFVAVGTQVYDGRFFVDLYFGSYFRFVETSTREMGEPRNFVQPFFNYGRRGPVPLGFVRVGFHLH